MERATKRKRVADNLQSDENKDPNATEKEGLKKQISDLRKLITRVEKTLQESTVKFGAIKNAEDAANRVSKHPVEKLQNSCLLFSKEMFELAGFHCQKMSSSEYVFKFSATGKNELKESCAVQICSKNDELAMGNWVMPMSIDATKILAEYPLTSNTAVIPFLRKCKHHVDCFTQRRSQYHELKERISDVVNVTIESNSGFTIIRIYLQQVYHRENDSFIKLTIYLSYKSDETRPQKIHTDWNLKNRPSDKVSAWMKAYTKCYKNHTLLDGFKQMTEKVNPNFTWLVENDALDFIQTDCSSESETDLIMPKAIAKNKRDLKRQKEYRKKKEQWKKRKTETVPLEYSKIDEMLEGSIAGPSNIARPLVASTPKPPKLAKKPKASPKRKIVKKNEKIRPKSAKSNIGKKKR